MEGYKGGWGSYKLCVAGFRCRVSELAEIGMNGRGVVIQNKKSC